MLNKFYQIKFGLMTTFFKHQVEVYPNPAIQLARSVLRLNVPHYLDSSSFIHSLNQFINGLAGELKKTKQKKHVTAT